MFVRLWNANLQNWDIHTVEVPCQPKRGPRDDYVKVCGVGAKPDDDGNFIRDDYTQREIDAVHAFAVARLTIDLWEKALNVKIRWPRTIFFTKSRLRIDLYDPFYMAVFNYDQHALLFGEIGANRKLACRSFDLVAHETTHAIINALRIGKGNTYTLEHRAVVEALCDISSILLQFSIPHFLEKALKETDNDLAKPNFISEFAEGYGNGHKMGLRSALNIRHSESDACDRGSVLVHEVYEKLSAISNRSLIQKEYLSELCILSSVLLTPLTKQNLTLNKLRSLNTQHHF